MEQTLSDLRADITTHVLSLLAPVSPLEALQALQAPVVRQAQDAFEEAVRKRQREALLAAGRIWYRCMRTQLLTISLAKGQ